MRLVLALLIGGAAALPGCSDPSPLIPASSLNTEDTVAVYAVTGTAVYQPSGYAVTEKRPVRLDASLSADFAYDVTSDGRHIFLPGRMVGQPGSSGIDPGLQATATPFDSITIALQNGYRTLDTVAVEPGKVFYVRGRVAPGCFLGLPTYAKVQVLDFDEARRTVRFRVLANANCGYRSLEPGLPKR
jgi:hypothetical protein